MEPVMTGIRTLIIMRIIILIIMLGFRSYEEDMMRSQQSTSRKSILTRI